MPHSWSEWVSFIGVIVNGMTSILALFIAYVLARRDRSDVRVSLTSEHAFKAMIENLHPDIRFGPHCSGDVPQEWCVISAVNTGLRPVHIEKAMIVSVQPNGPGSASALLPHDVLLNEEHRRTSMAFAPDFTPGHSLWLAAFVADTGREYV